MNYPFYKLTVAKNDFLLINLLGEVLPDEALLPVLSKAMCRRHRGIGGNGVLFLLDHPEAGARTRFFTAKGRELKYFYDPLLGAARYLFDSGFSGTKALTLDTPTGIRTIESIDSANFRISLGVPADGQGNEFREMINTDRGSFLSVENRTYPVTPVEVSQLWGVLFFEDDPARGKKSLAKALLKSRLLGSRFQPIFAQVYSDDDIAIQPWWNPANGLPETSLAAAAAAAAAAARGFTNRSLMTRCGSYDLFIEWKEQTGELLCTGGAEYIFTGDYYFDESALYQE